MGFLLAGNGLLLLYVTIYLLKLVRCCSLSSTAVQPAAAALRLHWLQGILGLTPQLALCTCHDCR